MWHSRSGDIGVCQWCFPEIALFRLKRLPVCHSLRFNINPIFPRFLDGYLIFWCC